MEDIRNENLNNRQFEGDNQRVNVKDTLVSLVKGDRYKYIYC